jgi:hypothetical protein
MVTSSVTTPARPPRLRAHRPAVREDDLEQLAALRRGARIPQPDRGETIRALGPETLIGLGVAQLTGAGKDLAVSAVGYEMLAGTRNRVIELTCELVRRLEFADKPSRMSCVFAYRTLEEARAYRASRRDPHTHEIWRVTFSDPGAVHSSDSRWLVAQVDALHILYVARGYWSGQTFPVALPVPEDMEVLVPLRSGDLYKAGMRRGGSRS